MHNLAYDYKRVDSAQKETTTVRTTLYELIETIHEVNPQSNNRLVREIVLDLIESESIRFLNSIRESASVD